jgi:hypothetical protein
MGSVPGKAGAITRLRKNVRNGAYEKTARTQDSLELSNGSIGIIEVLKSLEADHSINRALPDMHGQIIFFQVIMEKMDVGSIALLGGQFHQFRAGIDSDDRSCDAA